MTSEPSRRNSFERTLVLLLCVSTVAVGGFWAVRAAYVREAEQSTALNSSVPDVWPIGGMRVHFDPAAVTPVVDQQVVSPGGGRQLLLVASDICPGTALVLPMWRRLIQSLPFNKGDRVIVVSWGDETARELRDEAAKRGVQISVYSGSDLRAWSATTGFRSTPVTVGLDEDDRVRVLPANPLSERDYELLRRHFARSGAESRSVSE